MFIGHYGIGLALKKVEPRLSLGLLIFGAIMLDILFGLFLLSGIEHAKIVPGATVVSPFEFYDYPHEPQRCWRSFLGNSRFSGILAVARRGSYEKEASGIHSCNCNILAFCSGCDLTYS